MSDFKNLSVLKLRPRSLHKRYPLRVERFCQTMYDANLNESLTRCEDESLMNEDCDLKLIRKRDSRTCTNMAKLKSSSTQTTCKDAPGESHGVSSNFPTSPIPIQYITSTTQSCTFQKAPAALKQCQSVAEHGTMFRSTQNQFPEGSLQDDDGRVEYSPVTSKRSCHRSIWFKPQSVSVMIANCNFDTEQDTDVCYPSTATSTGADEEVVELCDAATSTFPSNEVSTLPSLPPSISTKSTLCAASQTSLTISCPSSKILTLTPLSTTVGVGPDYKLTSTASCMTQPSSNCNNQSDPCAVEKQVEQYKQIDLNQNFQDAPCVEKKEQELQIAFYESKMVCNKVEVGSCKKREVEGSNKVEVGSCKKREVEGSNKVEVGGCKKPEVEGSNKVEVGGCKKPEVEGSKKLEVGGCKKPEVEGSKKLEVGGCKKPEVGSCKKPEVGGCKKPEVRGCKKPEVGGSKKIPSPPYRSDSQGNEKHRDLCRLDSIYRAIFCPDPNDQRRSKDEVPIRRKSKQDMAVRKNISVSEIPSTETGIDLNEVRTQSMLKLNLGLDKTLESGLTGLKIFMENRGRLEDEDPERLVEFVDYFAVCDGMRYLQSLEQIDQLYTERCEGFTFSESLRSRLEDMAKVQQVFQELYLETFNFPQQLEDLFKTMSEIHYQPKMALVKRMHSYGLKMQQCWFTDITSGVSVQPSEVYNCGTRLLAEFASLVFALLMESCEFLVLVNKEIARCRNEYRVDRLIKFFQEFRRLTVEEVGAIGETCGEVMLRIPGLKKQQVENIMSKLYTQVYFVTICFTRAFKAVVPLIMLYYGKRKNSKSNDEQIKP